jgi:2-dehydropantoate 2-reductase
MKILIVGAGIIGVIYGWALSEAGADVTHFVRPGRKGRFPDGVTLDLLDERAGLPPHALHRYPIRLVETISFMDAYELIVMPVNGGQVDSALKALAPVSGNAVFLILSGNWEGTGAFDAVLSRERFLLGYPDAGGAVRGGLLWTNLGPEIHTGLLEGQSEDTLQRVEAVFARAGIQADRQKNILHWLWVHNAGVIGFAAGLAKSRNVDGYLADGALVRRSIRATREVYTLCGRRGVDLKKYPETGLLNLPVPLTEFLLKWNFRRNESMQRYTAHAVSESSFRETKYFYDRMMRSARELGVDAPFLKGLGEFLAEGHPVS